MYWPYVWYVDKAKLNSLQDGVLNFIFSFHTLLIQKKYEHFAFFGFSEFGFINLEPGVTKTILSGQKQNSIIFG